VDYKKSGILKPRFGKEVKEYANERHRREL
jgi:hypothetical protein